MAAPTSSGASHEGELLLRRIISSWRPDSLGAPGVLFYRSSPSQPWERVCCTLERPSVARRDAKGVLRGPRIPSGTYPVSYEPSRKQAEWVQKQQKTRADVNPDIRRPILSDVPGRTGIQIHIGNNVDQSEGCILVGEFPSVASVTSGGLVGSVDAFERVRALWTRRIASQQPGVIRIEELELNDQA